MSVDGKKIILDILFNSLENVKYNLAKTHIYARCIFCGDSRSDRNAASLNIRIPDDETPRWLYICFRSSCGEKGYIDSRFIRMLGHDNYEANVYLNKVNRTRGKNRRFQEKGKQSIRNFPSPNNRLSLAKLKYLNKRLGTDLSLKDLIDIKVHTDFESLYKYNEMKFPKSKEYYYRQLSLHGLAFISAYNDYLIVRNVTKNEKIRRYSMIDMFEDEFENDKFKFYIIPTKIDVMSIEPIIINMAEGTFDILSVYYNVDIDKDYNEHIHVSVSGSSYEKTLVHLIRQYGLVDIVVNIFSDKEVKLSTYNNLYKKISQYVNSMEMKVFYNELEKDFGVPKSKIELVENHIFGTF